MGLAPSMSLNSHRPQNTHGLSFDPTAPLDMVSLSSSSLSLYTLAQPFNRPTPPSPFLSRFSDYRLLASFLVFDVSPEENGSREIK